MAASAPSTIETIRQLASDHALQRAQGRDGEKLTVRAGNIDPRLRLATCQAGIETFDPHGARRIGSTLVGVRCLGPTRWTVYVAVDVMVETEVVVAHRGLARGQTVSVGDLRLERRQLSGLRNGYYSSLAQVQGLVAKRNLRAGAVLSPNKLKAPRLVRRGDRVTLLIRTGAVTVRARGESRADGAKGDIVNVRNAKTGKPLRGRVLAKGRVEILL